MVDRPDFLSSGDPARLIPVIADSRREQRVTSVFLSTFAAIPSFCGSLMNSLGQRLGQRSVVDTFTEVVFADASASNDRPDGLIRITTGGRTWYALVEAKIGKVVLDPEQVKRYAQLAKDYKIDAIITISNQFAARPDHSPVNIPKTLLKNVQLFHWSWKYILTEAMLQQSQGLVADVDQAFILREFIRFISHDSVGVTGFTQMPPEWRDLNELLKSGGVARKSGPEVESVVNAWHQETKDVSLRLSRHLATSCALKISKVHINDAARRLKDDCVQLSEKENLSVEYLIPNAASTLGICVDLKAQAIRVGMTVDAPQDRQSGLARLNWLLRQIKHVVGDKRFIRIIWPGRTRDLVVPLKQLKDDPKTALSGFDQIPRAFEVFLIKDDGRRFAGRKTFIEDLELAVPEFYDEIGQYMQEWRPKPPQPVSETELEPVVAKEEKKPAEEVSPYNFQPTKPANLPSQGNNHTDLLEIPEFLSRFEKS